MIKKLLAAVLALFAAAAFAAVDVNKATQADLESIKGIGPVIATKILDERKKGTFKDWNDMVSRVKGVGEGNAAKFSSDGLTVNGAAYTGAPAAAPKADTKPMAGSTEATGAKPMKTAAKADSAAAPASADKGKSPAASGVATGAKSPTKAEERAAKAEAKAEAKVAKKAENAESKTEKKAETKAEKAAPMKAEKTAEKNAAASAPASVKAAASAAAPKK